MYQSITSIQSPFSFPISLIRNFIRFFHSHSLSFIQTQVNPLEHVRYSVNLVHIFGFKSLSSRTLRHVTHIKAIRILVFLSPFSNYIYSHVLSARPRCTFVCVPGIGGDSISGKEIIFEDFFLDDLAVFFAMVSVGSYVSSFISDYGVMRDARPCNAYARLKCFSYEYVITFVRFSLSFLFLYCFRCFLITPTKSEESVR